MIHKKPGAWLETTGQCTFNVWAPLQKSMKLLLTAKQQEITMHKDEWGYFSVTVEDIQAGDTYLYQLADGETFPDPASFYQPKGVHDASAVVDHTQYAWQDIGWRGIPFKDLILYELHVGTFTEAGTFEAVIPHLDYLVDTGINAIEIMPVSQFSGHRNWGYDGVYPFAVQNSYGGPEALKALVDACHSKGIAVFLDVVYNHLGPEGNYLEKFGPYTTHKYSTPWGGAINFDDEYSDGVREYFSGNAMYWLEYFHMDGLRLDAIHTIFDNGSLHFWQLVHQKIVALEHEMGRFFYLIAESDLNDPRVIRSLGHGGYGFNAQWLDDFHHALYVLLDENGKDRYRDFGSLQHLAKAYKDGFVHSGEYCDFRKRKYGASSAGIAGEKFVVFNQNHDQAGNRVKGERLSMLVSPEKLKIAAAAILLSPYIPMLFMGEEFAAATPFYYFVSHEDDDLVDLVRKGRKEEFAAFQWKEDPPDPQAEETFNLSKLNWQSQTKGIHKILWQWHKILIQLRRAHPALQNSNKDNVKVNVMEAGGFALQRNSEDGSHMLLCLFNLSNKDINYVFPAGDIAWHLLLDSTQDNWTQENTAYPAFNSTGLTMTNNDELRLPPLCVLVFSAKKLQALTS